MIILCDSKNPPRELLGQEYGEKTKVIWWILFEISLQENEYFLVDNTWGG